jgi:hypothetical protein
MKTRNDKKKLFRLLLFLLTASLMTVASAQVYNYLYLQAVPISAKAAKIVFANGTDSSAAGTVIGTNGTYVKFTSLSGWPNVTRVYENASVIKNLDSAVNFPFQLSRSSLSGNTADISQLYVQLYNAAGTWEGTLDLVAGNTTTFTIPNGAVWRVQWTIKWSATALGTDTLDAVIALRATGEGTGE